MNITSPEKLSSTLWKQLFLCCLVIIAIAVIVIVRLTYLPTATDATASQMIEMTCWRISLLLAFQSAPLVWAHFIFKGYKYKRISIPLYQTMALLRMPLATWTAACLLIGVTLWPDLNI